MKYWDMFEQVYELVQSPPWDGDTPDDSVKRLSEFAKSYVLEGYIEED